MNEYVRRYGIVMALCGAFALVCTHRKAEADTVLPLQTTTTRPVLLPSAKFKQFGVETTPFAKTFAERPWVASNSVGFTVPLDEPRPKDEKYDISLHFGGWSDHGKSGKCVRGLCVEYRERNPIVGVTVWLWDFAGGRTFVEGARITTNSLGGTTDWAMAGIEWNLYRGNLVDVCGGIGPAHIKYRLPYAMSNLANSQSKSLVAVYGCLKRGPTALRFTPTARRDSMYLNLTYSVKFQ
jgi:hypothetical protein